MRTLVLNSGFEPVKVVEWQRAIVMLLNEKAVLVAVYQGRIKAVSRSFARPKVIRLKRYVNVLKGMGQSVPYSRINVFRRDDFICQYCEKQLNSSTATIDHILPQSRGGLNSWTNTVCACECCNRRKGNRTPEEAGMTLIRAPKKPNPLKYLVSQFGEIDWDEIWQHPEEDVVISE